MKYLKAGVIAVAVMALLAGSVHAQSNRFSDLLDKYFNLRLEKEIQQLEGEQLVGARTEESGLTKKDISGSAYSQVDSGLTAIIPDENGGADLGSTDYKWDVVYANTISGGGIISGGTTNTIPIYSSATALTTTTLNFASNALYPSVTNTIALGTSSSYSDLFLGSGAVINFDGDVTLTHATDALTFAGGTTTFSGDLIANGIVNLGDNGDTVAINSSDWDINATGDTSGIGTLSLDGDITFAATTPSIILNNAETFKITDGTNTLLTLTDQGIIADLTVSGDLLVNGGDFSSTTSTFNFLSANATTVSFATAATALQFGATSGTTTVNNNLAVADNSGMIVGHTVKIITDTTPEFQVLGTTAADSAQLIGSWGANAFGAELQFTKSRAATIGGAATIVADNDNIGGIFWYPDDGTDMVNNSAGFFAEADGTMATNSIPTAFVWQTQAGGGASLTEKMRLEAAGGLALSGYIKLGATSANNLFTLMTERSFTPGVGNDAAQIKISGGGQITEAASGVHNTISAFAVDPLTVNNGGAQTTNLAALYIEAAPSGTATSTNGPYSLFVDAGDSRFDGAVITQTVSTTAGSINLTPSTAVGITTSTPLGDLHVAGNTSATTSTLVLGVSGAKAACIQAQDTDKAGWSYGTLLNGVITWSTTPCI